MTSSVQDAINGFLPEFTQGGRYVPARLLAAMALLERLRESPELDLSAHLASVSSNGLKAHERFGRLACERINVRSPVSTYGRRSNEIRAWAPKLFAILEQLGFANLSNDERALILDEIQSAVGEVVREIVEIDPITVRCGKKTVSTIISEVLDQAEQRQRHGDVAQYLVAAKLQIRLPESEIEARPANVGDGSWLTDPDAEPADFLVSTTAIEVAVGMPDEKHINQVLEILDSSTLEVLLIVRSDRRDGWMIELSAADVDLSRVVVLGISEFICQNMCEMGGFDRASTVEQLHRVVQLYNVSFVDTYGVPGMRIELLS